MLKTLVSLCSNHNLQASQFYIPPRMPNQEIYAELTVLLPHYHKYSHNKDTHLCILQQREYRKYLNPW